MVANKPAATSDEDGWLFGQTRPILLAAAVGRAVDAESVRSDAAANGAVGASGVGEAIVVAKSARKEASGGAVSEKSVARAVVLSPEGPQESRTGSSWGAPAAVRLKTGLEPSYGG